MNTYSLDQFFHVPSASPSSYDLLKPGEALPFSKYTKTPSAITFEPGNKFRGDYKSRFHGYLPTNDELIGMLVWNGRNDINNPNYRHGNKLIKTQCEICFEEDFFHPYKTIDQRIFDRIRDDA